MTAEDKGLFPFTSDKRLTEEDLSPYAPFGFAYDDNYWTVFYCREEEENFATGTLCNTGNSTTKIERLLLTLGPIPEKWRSYDNSGKFTPSIDFMNAMHAQFLSTDKAGYVTKIGENIEIKSALGETIELPPGDPLKDEVEFCLEHYDGTCLIQMTTM